MSPSAAPISRELVVSEALYWRAKLAGKDCLYLDKASHSMQFAERLLFGVKTPREEASKLKMHLPSGMGGRQGTPVALRGLEIRMGGVGLDLPGLVLIPWPPWFGFV